MSTLAINTLAASSDIATAKDKIDADFTTVRVAGHPVGRDAYALAVLAYLANGVAWLTITSGTLFTFPACLLDAGTSAVTYFTEERIAASILAAC